MFELVGDGAVALVSDSRRAVCAVRSSLECSVVGRLPTNRGSDTIIVSTPLVLLVRAIPNDHAIRAGTSAQEARETPPTSPSRQKSDDATPTAERPAAELVQERLRRVQAQHCHVLLPSCGD
jgi:hypothetical protein